MKTSITAKYKAKTSTGSSIEITSHGIPLDVHKMIVWCLNNPDHGMKLVRSYEQLREGVNSNVLSDMESRYPE